MNALALFRTAQAGRLLRRAARAAAMPLSVHFCDAANEGARVWSSEACGACRFVHDQAAGARACRKSRQKASREALAHGTATPFLCHMGFSCVCMPVFAEAGEGFVITLGPYCPAEAPELLEADARSGLEALGVEVPAGKTPFLVGLHHVPSQIGPAVAEWTADALVELLERQITQGQAPEKDADAPAAKQKARRRPGPAPEATPYGAAAIAAALVGGDQNQVRALVKGALAETPAEGRGKLAARRARMTALVAAVIESAERAGLRTAICWERFPGFIEEVQKARTDAAIAAAATGLLAAVKLKVVRRAKDDAGMGALNRILKRRIADAITLNEVAAELGLHPTAITHRLQRKFGLSFSQYVGRLRVDKAKELLRRTNLGTGAVAKRVGIGDTSNFGKLFRKFEGCSPSEYRKRHGRKS